MNKPRFSALSSTSLVWLVPLVAVVASAWLVMRGFRQAGPVIELEFANGAGIVAGKTPLVHKGVAIGLVKEVALKPGLDGVTVTVELEASARPVAVEGSEFWLVRPEFGFSGVRGLDTLLSGARLGVRAGSGAPAHHFVALERSPPSEDIVPGRNFVLRSGQLSSLQTGSQVYFREVKVGIVEDHRLADDATHVLIMIRIFEPHDRLVRAETKFWNSGGLSMKVGLLGAEVLSKSLQSLFSGGVSFATPDNSAGAEPAAEGSVFELHDKADNDWLKWAPSIPLEEAPPASSKPAA